MNKSQQIEIILGEPQAITKAIFNQGIKFIGLMQPDGNLLEINNSALNFSGLNSSEVIGRPLWSAWRWRNSKLTQKKLQAAIYRAAAGECVDSQVEILGNGDRSLTCEFLIKPIRNQQGKVIFLILEGHSLAEADPGVVEDIATIFDSEARFRIMVDQAPVMIWMSGVDKLFNFFNKSWLEFTGRTIVQEFGHGWTEAVHPEDVEQCINTYTAAFEARSPFAMEYRLRRFDGEYRWILDKGTPHFASDGIFAGFIGSCIDISDRKQTELALQQRAEELTRLNTILTQTTAMLQKRNQELDQFAYVTSHDLKAPLRAIASISEWLEEDLAGQLSPENQHQLNLLRGRVHRMEGLINGLLEYSRVGQTHTDLSVVNLQELLQEVIDSLERPFSFQMKVAEGMPTFTTKRIPLQQVFTNLIENAIKHHSRPDGQVTISVQEQGRYYKFTVADDGPGISQEYHHKIFSIFQTLEARDRKESTGIGLAIVKKIVETEGGTIHLDSQVGVGSSFYFTWPKQF